jgi:general secretion pathway protein D
LIAATFLSACNQFVSNNDQTTEPGVFDRVRSLDLLPRFPREEQSSAQNTNRAKPAVYGGTEVPVLSPPTDQPAASGDGYELNFENTPVATVAKVVLGDIMGFGYSIDPRIQGTVSLSSGRPVPKSDMLFVLRMRYGSPAWLWSRMQRAIALFHWATPLVPAISIRLQGGWSRVTASRWCLSDTFRQLRC